MQGLKLEDFGWHTLDRVDLEVPQGQCVGLHGPSGSGKSLMLRAIADLIPHGGRVWLDGTSCDNVPGHQWRRWVGLLPAEAAWWFDSVGEHFGEVPGAWLQALGLGPEVFTWQVRRLSSGERQRLALLRLLANSPRVLLLDEPTANLDAENTLRVERLIDDYRRRHQPIVFWVSHDPAQLRRWCEPIFSIAANRLKIDEMTIPAVGEKTP